MKAETALFYDADTQRDFIMPDGRLSIPGADRVIPKLAAITNLARRLNARIVASTDRHRPGDPELQRNGGQYPDHCMDGTPGQKKIDATAPLDPMYITSAELSEAGVEAAIRHNGELVFEKQLFDVFAGNRNAETILRRLLQRYTDVVVYGVYTEVCVADAVRGLLKLGRKIHLVTDATADIGAEGNRYRMQWRTQGVDLLTVAQSQSQLISSRDR